MPITFRADPSTQEFLDFAARGEFLLYRDPESRSVHGPHVTHSPATPDLPLVAFAASGRATLVSYTIVPGKPSPNDPAPRSVVAIGELEEGPWWWAEIEGADPEDMKIGAPLRIAFREINDGQHVPVFAPA